MTTRVACLLFLLIAAVGCSHSHAPPGASPLSARERRVVAADGVVVTATRWDDTVIALAAAEVTGPERAATQDRLQARYGGGTSFTVVIELADRPRDADVLVDPDQWWFRCGGEPPERALLIAIDRFPTGDGRAHVRLGFDVGFAHATKSSRTLQVGSKATVSRRAELGRSVARRGVALRW